MDWEYFLDRHCEYFPKTLFHYTNVNGFNGILGTNCIWATDTRYLNDMVEYRHGVSLFQQELKRVKTRKKDHVFFQKISENCLNDLLSVEARLNEKFTYCVSFSEEEDLLSQWRAYANIDGLNIGFDHQSLKTASKKQGFRLMKCLYSEDKKKEFVRKVVDDFLWHYNASIQNEAIDHYSPTHFGIYLRSMISFLAPLLKHKAFFEEKEWRVVHCYGILPDPEPRKSSEKPHTCLNLQDVLVRKIFIGPGNDMDSTFLRILPSIMPILNSRQLIGVCKKSEIPYRG